ncbi:MAG: AAA family ATPase [Candidatus Saccharibacteria bacterium]
MHLKSVAIRSHDFPTIDFYPFNQEIFRATEGVKFRSPVSFFVGENGSGKSTLLKAIASKCDIHIWRENFSRPYQTNLYENDLCKYIELEWIDKQVPGCFFAADNFRNFAIVLDDWARTDPGILKYFGGESLITKSHGQCHMAFFRSRYAIEGLYLLDEPENALSPKKQVEFLQVLKENTEAGHAQFIIATHSPILLAFPGADIYSFDQVPIQSIQYEETDYYKVYRDFLQDREKYMP